LTIGRLESSLSGVVVWDNDGEELDGEESLCGSWLDIGVKGDGLGELGRCEEFGVLEEDGTMFRIVSIEGSTKGIGKTCWTKFASCVEEGKKGVSSWKVTLVDM